MAYEGNLQTWTFVGKGGVTFTQFSFVKLSTTAQQIDMCSAATDIPIGVLLDKAPAADLADGTRGSLVVALSGIVKVIAGANNLAIGDILGTDTSGRAVKLTPGTDTTKYSVGVALAASSAIGDLIPVLFSSYTPGRAA